MPEFAYIMRITYYNTKTHHLFHTMEGAKLHVNNLMGDTLDSKWYGDEKEARLNYKHYSFIIKRFEFEDQVAI